MQVPAADSRTLQGLLMVLSFVDGFTSSWTFFLELELRQTKNPRKLLSLPI